MTGSDLILLAPWVAFAVGLAVVVLRLRLFRRRPAPPPREWPRYEVHDGGERR